MALATSVLGARQHEISFAAATGSFFPALRVMEDAEGEALRVAPQDAATGNIKALLQGGAGFLRVQSGSATSSIPVRCVAEAAKAGDEVVISLHRDLRGEVAAVSVDIEGCTGQGAVVGDVPAPKWAVRSVPTLYAQPLVAAAPSWVDQGAGTEEPTESIIKPGGGVKATAGPEKVDDRGFFAKHWMKILVGVVLVANLASLFVPPEPQGGQRGGRAPPAR